MSDYKYFDRYGGGFVLLCGLLVCSGGCLSATLGKVGVKVPSLVQQKQDSDIPEYTPSVVDKLQMRGQNRDEFSAPYHDEFTTPNNSSGAPLSDLPNGADLFSQPLTPPSPNGALTPANREYWDNPLGDGISPNEGQSLLETAPEPQKRAASETSNAASYDPNKPWLKPLPHPYGPFAYRTESETRGFGGELPAEDPIPFEPITKNSQDKPASPELYDWEKEDKPKFDWSMFDPANFATKVRDWMGMGPDERKAAAFMESGYNLIRQNRDFKNIEKNIQAAKEFEKAAARWPDSVLEEDALFLAGECYFFSEKYPQAAKNYTKLITKHRGTKYMDSAVLRMFRIGRYWEARYEKGASYVNFQDKTRPHFDTFGEMRKAYEAIYTNDPTGPMGDKALMALAGAFMNKGQNQGDSQFAEAAALYASLPDINPRSDYLVQARKLELMARSMSYVGAQYDGKSLEEASTLADQTLRQFGEELGQEKGNIIDLKESLYNQQAERLWEMGQFYEKKKMYSSARFNYELLIKEYGVSGLVPQAEERYAAIRNLDDQDDHLAWLKKRFDRSGSPHKENPALTADQYTLKSREKAEKETEDKVARKLSDSNDVNGPKKPTSIFGGLFSRKNPENGNY